MKTDKEIRKDWFEFANNAFMEWRGNTRKTLTEFAEWIGISQPVMSLQLKKGGSIPKDHKTINAWCSRYGITKIHTILDIPIQEVSFDLAPVIIQSIALEIGEIFKARGLEGGEPEAFEVVNEIMKKHGLKQTSSRDSSASFS
jgi:uncharacterized protein (UPF0276 family)